MASMWKGAGRAPRERLLVCLDLQLGSLPADHAPDRCIVNCRRVLAHAREAGWRVVHVHSRKADAGEARPIPGLEPLLSEPVVYRSMGSAFSSSAFRRIVAGMANGDLVIIGYSLSASCLATALIAHDNDLAATLVEDAVCSNSLNEETRRALGVLARQMARPFVTLSATDAVVGGARMLRVV